MINKDYITFIYFQTLYKKIENEKCKFYFLKKNLKKRKKKSGCEHKGVNSIFL